MKLTDSQRKYLAAAPFKLTHWGNQIQSGKPFKGFNENRAFDLTRAGLLRTSKPEAFTTVYTLTDKGREVLGP